MNGFEAFFLWYMVVGFGLMTIILLAITFSKREKMLEAKKIIEGMNFMALLATLLSIMFAWPIILISTLTGK